MGFDWDVKDDQKLIRINILLALARIVSNKQQGREAIGMGLKEEEEEEELDWKWI